jgi:hypothetical protein
MAPATARRRRPATRSGGATASATEVTAPGADQVRVWGEEKVDGEAHGRKERAPDGADAARPPAP